VTAREVIVEEPAAIQPRDRAFAVAELFEEA
jgi:hypothetical protein